MTPQEQDIAMTRLVIPHARGINFYSTNRELIFGAMKKLGLQDRDNLEVRVKWINNLRDIVSRRMPKNKMGWPMVSDIDLLMAENDELIESILKTFNKWKK
jgi:hypothetical protein